MLDLIIIGGGPAGTSAAVYAGRKQLRTLLVTESFGGQSIVSPGIENWIGEKNISGIDLAKKLEEHANAYTGETLEIQKGVVVTNIKQNSDKTFTVSVQKNDDEIKHQTRSILIATGSNRRKIQAENADKFEHKGLTYCASCDGPIFRDKDVVVAGGGNAAFESAAQLLAYCKSVTLIHRRDEFRADPVTIEALKKNPKFKIITNAEITEILGDGMVSGLKYKDTQTQTEIELATSGIFVEIGAVPVTDFVGNLVELNDGKHIKANPRTQRTNVDGIWAAGDCTDVLYYQNNIAAGDAVKALEDIYIWLNKN